MPAIKLCGYVFLVCLLLFATLEPIIFRKWFKFSRYIKDIGGIVVSMIVGFSLLSISSLLISLVAPLKNYLDNTTYSSSYVALAGNSPTLAMMGLVAIMSFILFGGVWLMMKLGRHLMPYNEEEKELATQANEWWRSKMLKSLQSKRNVHRKF